MDDSGTRKPDRAPTVFDPKRPSHYALGGILIREEDEDRARGAHAALCEKWSITYPLHSVDMRSAAKEFRWLRRDSPEYQPFMEDLTRMLLGIPALGPACVIDRPGYDARYREKYGRNQWQLCRTAFIIAVERAAKHARRLGYKLRVLPERSNKDDEGRIRQYYRELREQGSPFDAGTSNQYAPLSAKEFAETLVELDFKRKSSPMAQIADLYLWPILRERYRPGYRPYREFRAAGRLIECVLTDADVPTCGSKYSCFELVDAAEHVHRAQHQDQGYRPLQKLSQWPERPLKRQRPGLCSGLCGGPIAETSWATPGTNWGAGAYYMQGLPLVTCVRLIPRAGAVCSIACFPALKVADDQSLH